MRRLDWLAWRDETDASTKRKLLARLVADNEPLVQRFASRFLEKTQGPPDFLRDDVFQAARIGLITAIRKFDPDKGALSTLAWHLMRKEMQLVMRDATPLTYPDKVVFTRPAKPDSRFAELQRLAQGTFTGLRAAAQVPAADEADPEGDIDRKRDVEALQAFLAGLTKKQVKEFWTGENEALTTRAKVFVEYARANRGSK